MGKSAKVLIAVVVIAIAVLICYNTLGKKGPVSTETDNTIVEENTVENEVIEDNTVNNEVENEVVNEVVENKVETPSVPKSSANAYESDSDVGSTNKKEEAIKLVKEKWGEDDTVSFTCDSITSDGEYVVAVNSKEKASVLNYFRVNLEKKTVVVDY